MVRQPYRVSGQRYAEKDAPADNRALSDIRIVNAELRNMLMSPQREHIMMVFILLANYPILYFINADWFSVLFDTIFGQVVNCIVAVVVIVTVILAYKYTQPIQYKR